MLFSFVNFGDTLMMLGSSRDSMWRSDDDAGCWALTTVFYDDVWYRTFWPRYFPGNFLCSVYLIYCFICSFVLDIDTVPVWYLHSFIDAVFYDAGIADAGDGRHSLPVFGDTMLPDWYYRYSIVPVSMHSLLLFITLFIVLVFLPTLLLLTVNLRVLFDVICIVFKFYCCCSVLLLGSDLIRYWYMIYSDTMEKVWKYDMMTIVMRYLLGILTDDDC